MELSAITFVSPFAQLGHSPSGESASVATDEKSTQGTPPISGTHNTDETEREHRVHQSDGGDSVASAAGSEASKESTAVPEDTQEQSGGLRELTPEEKQRVAELKAIDTKVRAHERAHLAAAGSLARGGASFEYVSGPDGQRYAVSGEVSIDTSGVSGDPAATIAKAQNIKRAALAPSQPSSQDQRVAAHASQLEFEARAELAEQRAEKVRESATPNNESASPIADRIPQQTQPIDLFI